MISDWKTISVSRSAIAFENERSYKLRTCQSCAYPGYELAEPMVRMQAAQSDNREVLDFLTTDRDATVARCAMRTLFDLDDKLPDNL